MATVICYICRTRPRASITCWRCLECERVYQRSPQRRAAKVRWSQRNKVKVKRQREDRITWWMNLTLGELKNIKKWYRESNKDLPGTYRTAMIRVARRRDEADIAQLKGLPPKLAKAAIQWRKACASGSRPSDYNEAKHGGKHGIITTE